MFDILKLLYLPGSILLSQPPRRTITVRPQPQQLALKAARAREKKQKRSKNRKLTAPELKARSLCASTRLTFSVLATWV